MITYVCYYCGGVIATKSDLTTNGLPKKCPHCGRELKKEIVFDKIVVDYTPKLRRYSSRRPPLTAR
jgi:DNA-directed RNA polymerase subunit RPC12/RpoP